MLVPDPPLPSVPHRVIRERPAPITTTIPTKPRRSLNLRTRTARLPPDRIQTDALSLLERIPPSVTASALVKSARHGIFAKSQRLWLQLRGRIVLLTKDSEHFAGLFAVHSCTILRKHNLPIIKLTNSYTPNAVWIKFDDHATADLWEKALYNVIKQRVVGISDFEFISPIGKGASGKVFLVSDRKTGHKLALKIVDKKKVFHSKTALRHALHERLALQLVDGHPFFSRLRYAFQTRAFFYLAIDFYDGGDLYQYLRTHSGRLKEPQVRVVSAQVLCALEYLHKLGFVYRDLKPENVLLDNKGNVRLADFGLCKFLPDITLTNTICGTHTYAAPEMLGVRNYGKSVDLWAFGVFVYHMLRGKTPYEARDLDQVIANMNNRRIRFSSGTSPELVNMVKRLLDWNPDTRLGCGTTGCAQVREHPFFQGMDWRKILLRENDMPVLADLDNKFRNGQASQTTSTTSPISAPAQGTMRVDLAVNGQRNAGEARTNANLTNDERQMPSTLIVTDEYAHMDALGGAQVGNTVVGSRGGTSDEIKQNGVKHERIKRDRDGVKQYGISTSEGGQNAGRGSLRERMKAAAAEQDDLRNFDMSEWGKVSVDQDYDDAEYGDESLWPIAKARRKVVEDEWLIVGYGYSSSSAETSGSRS